MGKNLGSQIVLAFERLLDAFVSIVPAVMVLAASLLVGLAVGFLLRALFRGLIGLRRKARKDEPSSSRQLLRAAGLRAEPERLAAEASFWIAVVVGLTVGVNARAAHVFVVASFVAAALDHLGIGRSILVAAFSIAAGSLALTFALAFGLGGRDLAKAWLERKLRAEEEDTGIRHV